MLSNPNLPFKISIYGEPPEYVTSQHLHSLLSIIDSLLSILSMTGRNISPLPFILIFLITAMSPASAAIRGGYYPSWSTSDLPPSTIDASLFTHLFYAFADLDATSYRITIADDQLISNFTSTMRLRNVKTLLSIGSGGSNSNAFAAMASTAASRAVFINSTIKTARNYGFDGLDLDWETPADQSEMNDLGKLLVEWRAAVVAEARASGKVRLLLTAAVYFCVDVFYHDDVRRSYPIESVRAGLDWVNVMTYDYRGYWDTSATGAPAALYDPNSNISTSFGINSWLQAGMPAGKVVMGLPLYGHTWKLRNAAVNGIGAQAVGIGTGDEGTMSFAEVVGFNAANRATVVYDGTTVSTYSYAGTNWIGYDDERSTAKKVKFAVGRSLGGYFFWSINQDKNWRISKQAFTAWGT